MNTETVLAMNHAKLQKRVESLSEDDRFSAQKFWKAKKSIQGRHQACNSVYNENGREVFEDDDIIEAYRSEFDKRLTSVEIRQELRDYKELTDKLCEEILKTS